MRQDTGGAGVLSFFIVVVVNVISSDTITWYVTLQGWAKEWSLGCVNSLPAARRSQEAGFTQPRDHSLAQACIYKEAPIN